ncbi:MAG: FkbM family methyltransferase [Pirellula sp.]
MRLRNLPGTAATAVQREWKAACWKLNQRIRKTTRVTTRQGIYEVNFADRGISKELYCKGQFELELMEKTFGFLRDQLGLLPPEGQGVLLDVGANIGVISIGALLNNQVASAIAIEPDPNNFLLLEKNIRLNGVEDRMNCFRMAASDATSELAFELSKRNYGDHRVRRIEKGSGNRAEERHDESNRSVIHVQADRLDRILKNVIPNVSLIWIDVQGFEGYAFRGAADLLRSKIPVVSEIWPYGIHRAGMSTDDFCQIAQGFFRDYWVWRRNSFVRYPIELLETYFIELGDDAFDNVIFT